MAVGARLNANREREADRGGRAAPDWHAVPVTDAIAALDTASDGLASASARERLGRYGANRVRPPARPSALKRLLGQFNNVLIYVLIGAAALTLALGHWVDAAVIAGVVVINALIGFVQEGRAEHALEAIRAVERC